MYDQLHICRDDQPERPGLGQPGPRWTRGSVLAQVYWTLRQHVDGLRLNDLIDLLVPAVVAHQARYRLRQLIGAGHVRMDTTRKRYFATLVDPEAYPLEQLRTDALAELVDCPAGMSDEVLAAELECGICELHAALREPRAGGQVRRIQIDMAVAAGGGMGWALSEQVPVGSDVPPKAHVIVGGPGPTGHALIGQHGSYAITEGQRLQLAWGEDAPMRVTLPPETTRELMRWLDQLGGLDLSARLSLEVPA